MYYNFVKLNVCYMEHRVLDDESGNDSGEWWFSNRPPENSKETFITYKYIVHVGR